MLGDGHAAAVVDQNTIKKDNRIITKEDKRRAMERHNQAIHQLWLEKEQHQKSERNQVEARIKALEVEKARSALIASLPPPRDIISSFEPNKKQNVQTKKTEDFKSTHYHLQKPIVQVEKMAKEGQIDARSAAEEEEDKIHGVIEDAQRSQAEQAEKALLRHKHALAQLRIEEDHKRLMDELGELERMDRQRRQDAVAKIPVRIFQPPHKRVEDAEERQRDLEQAFEDMYMLQTGYTGDLTVALEPSMDPTLIPEEHQLLVSDDEISRQNFQEETISSVASQKADEQADDIREVGQENAERGQDDDISEEERKNVREESKAVKGEDAVKRLLLRIQKQREQAKKERPTDTTENVEKSRKTPATPSRTIGKHIGSRVNVLTPLPEEEEQPPDEDIPRAHPPRPQATALDPTEEHETHILRHPYEAARQARAVISRAETDEAPPSTSEETMPSSSFSQDEALMEQQRLESQLEEQRFIQQRLEEQLRDYRKKFQAPSTEEPATTRDAVTQMKDRIEEVQVNNSALEDHRGDVRGEINYLEEREEESLPSIESGALSPEEQTADEGETSGTSSITSDPWSKLIRPHQTSLQRPSTENEDPIHMDLSTKAPSKRSLYDSESDEDDSQKVLPPKRAFVRKPVPSFDGQPPGHQQHETTGESFPKESSSDSEGRLESDGLSSSSTSLDFKHQEIPTSVNTRDRLPGHVLKENDRPLAFRQSQVVSDSFPSLTLDSFTTASSGNKFSPGTLQNNTANSVSTTDEGIESSPTFPFQTVPDLKSSFVGTRFRKSFAVPVTSGPFAQQATSSTAKAFDGSSNYLDEYRRKWEEEKKLIENQRNLIKQKQEQQLRRMRYYKEILDGYENDRTISSDVVHPVISGESPNLALTSIGGGVGSSSIQSQLSDKFRLGSDHKLTSSDNSSRDFANKENESVYANKKQSTTPPLVILKRSSSSSDNSYRRSLPWTSDSSSSGRIGNRFSSIIRDSQGTRKSTSTSDVSFPSSGTEYHSLPISPEPSTYANTGLADNSRSSITTLSELNEMMTKLTSSSENEVDKQISRKSAKPVERTRWSEYLAEKTASDGFDSKSLRPRTTDVIPTQSAEYTSSVTHSSNSETHPTSCIGSHVRNFPQEIGIISERPLIDNKWFQPTKTSSQATSISGLSSNDSSLENRSLPRRIIGSDDPQLSSRKSRIKNKITNKNTPIQQQDITSKDSIHSVSAPRLISEDQSPSNRHVSSAQSSRTSSTSEFQQWSIPSRTSTHPGAFLGPVGDNSNTSTQDANSSSVQSLSTSNISPFQQLVVPPNASTQSVASLRHVGDSSNTRDLEAVSGITQSSSTNNSSPIQQWVVPPKASTQSVASLGPISEDSSTISRDASSNIQSLSTSISSPVQQWLVLPKASTQSMGSPGVIDEEPSSATQEWVVPAKASTQSMGSFGPISEDSSPSTSASRYILRGVNQSPVKWYLPTKASTQSLPLQESIHGESSPDQSVFLREPLPTDAQNLDWHIPQRLPTISLGSLPILDKHKGKPKDTKGRSGSAAFTQSLLGENDDSAMRSGSIATKLAGMNALLRDSMSSGSLETDNNDTSQSAHSKTESSCEHTKENDPWESPNTTLNDDQRTDTEKEEEETLKNIAIESDRSSDHLDLIQTEDHVGVSTVSDTLSLQAAFAQRKQDFVQKSLARVARAKEKRLEVKPRVQVKPRLKKVQPKTSSKTEKQPKKK